MHRESHKQLVLSRPGRLVNSARQASLPAGEPNRPRRGAILHPTDYSEPSRLAFELACRIAREQGSRLLVLHVAEPVFVSSTGMAPMPPLPKGYRGAWESRLRLMQPRDPTVPVEHRLEEGDVAAAILRVAREEHCGLIVMSGRQRTRLGRLLAGSITEKVERMAPCPVLRLHVQRAPDTVRVTGEDSGASDRTKPKAILHPTDFSLPARHGFEVACSLARESGSELIIAHVGPVFDLHCGSIYRDDVEAALLRMAASASAVRARWELRAGDPTAEILRMARDGCCDLIVMGTRRRTGLGRLFGRGVTAKVRRKSACPVVTVNVPPDGFATIRRQPPRAAAGPASDTDPDGGSYDFSSNHPAPDGFLALRR